MVAVSVGGRAGEHGDDDLRLEAPDHGDDVFENRVARPEAERLLGRLREAEVVCAREELLRAIELARGEQLLGPDDAELGAKLGADQVLASLAARQGQVRCLRTHAAGQQDEQLRVLIVGMRPDHEDALVAAELAERGGQSRDAAGACGSQLGDPGNGGGDTKEEGEADLSHY